LDFNFRIQSEALFPAEKLRYSGLSSINVVKKILNVIGKLKHTILYIYDTALFVVVETEAARNML
jgi:hypothetical protein